MLLCLLILPLSALAEYKCTMPNGVVVVSKLSPCPSDAVKSVAPGGIVTYGKPPESKPVQSYSAPASPRPQFVVPSRPEPKVDHDETLEYKLATLNARGFVPRDHISVARIRSLLIQLSSTYVESKERIGDMTFAAQQSLRDEGIDESLLNIMEGMNQIFINKVENQKYAEYVSAYIVLRGKGQSHLQTIGGLKSLIQRIVSQ